MAGPTPINLNKAGKARARAAEAALAAGNRIAHGRTKAEKSAAAARNQLAAQRLDGARREP